MKLKFYDNQNGTEVYQWKPFVGEGYVGIIQDKELASLVRELFDEHESQEKKLEEHSARIEELEELLEEAQGKVLEPGQ